MGWAERVQATRGTVLAVRSLDLIILSFPFSSLPLPDLLPTHLALKDLFGDLDEKIMRGTICTPDLDIILDEQLAN